MFCKSALWITSSPYLLGGTLKARLDRHLLAGIDIGIIEKRLRNFYVDDSTNSVQSVTEGTDFYRKSKDYMHAAGLELKKWASNNTELHSLIQKAENNGPKSFSPI